MLKFVLLFLTLSGLQARPIAAPGQRTFSSDRLPDGFRRSVEHAGIRERVPDGFRQGTEPSRKFLVDLNTGLVKEHISEMERRVVPVDVPAQRRGAGWVRVEKRSIVDVPETLRQEIKSRMSIPIGFRQGTEPKMSIPVGFRQGTEPKMSLPVAFRQGTEPKMSIPVAFRQGTEPKMSIPVAFRQGTEPKMSIPVAFRQGTEPEMSNLIELRKEAHQNMQRPVAFKQATRVQTHKMACNGEIINGKCYEFNPNLLSYKDAQAFCRNLAPNAELASITNRDLHSRLVSLVTKGGENKPVLTWLGGIVKNQQALWVDGSKWSYSDWMPGHPNFHANKPACVEMFKIDESWWSVADCELKRASLCSYPVTA
ncbi:uncharacterized protein LOC103155846 [Poecilia formosa]|nr:PREDICTED: uncharacterized protein LOC103155846 [Poecilia formosa]